MTDRREAFWTVTVRQSLPVRPAAKFPSAGETRALGAFGSHSDVSVEVLAHAALTYARPDTPRELILNGLGRAIGRTAAHELAHAILGVTDSMDNRTDEASYDYYSFARSAQYFGELHWGPAWPRLVQKLSK